MILQTSYAIQCVYSADDISPDPLCVYSLRTLSLDGLFLASYCSLIHYVTLSFLLLLISSLRRVYFDSKLIYYLFCILYEFPSIFSKTIAAQ